MQNVAQTVVSQYANSPVLNALISSFNDWIDPSANIDLFYRMSLDLDTAQGQGLDRWGRIVGVGRVLKIPVGRYFGFRAKTNLSMDPFNVSPFYAGEATTSNYPLSDTGYRTLIYAKALANISDGSIGSINAILLMLFPGRGNCYVQDGLNMTMTYVFDFALSLVEQAIVVQSGVLPRPVGVSANVTQMTSAGSTSANVQPSIS
jgi:hypothetical protein